MKKTPLFDRHLQLKANIIDFGGWALPVQYSSVIEEHRITRTAAGLFDICHMGEVEVRGPGAFGLLQDTMSRNLSGQAVGQMKLSVLPNAEGGIIDDLTIYKMGEEHYMVVTNAVTKDKDVAWLEAARSEKGYASVTVRDLSDVTGKLDLQGPGAEAILQEVAEEDLSGVRFYHFTRTKVVGIPAIVSRSGYTGEDGFEIYADSGRIGEIFDTLLHIGEPRGLTPAGLGARDTLRIEAGMMLYGHEMDESVTPFEVTYGWLVDPAKEFTGAGALRARRGRGFERKLVGFEMAERGIARRGYRVFREGGEIGVVTSGTFAPSLNKAVGFAFVRKACQEPGTEIEIEIRTQRAKARVVPLPFYKRAKR